MNWSIKEAEIYLYPFVDIEEQTCNYVLVHQVIVDYNKHKRSEVSEKTHYPASPFIQFVNDESSPHPQHEKNGRYVKQCCQSEKETRVEYFIYAFLFVMTFEEKVQGNYNHHVGKQH